MPSLLEELGFRVLLLPIQQNRSRPQSGGFLASLVGSYLSLTTCIHSCRLFLERLPFCLEQAY